MRRITRSAGFYQWPSERSGAAEAR
jgi:hypothetical protein